MGMRLLLALLLAVVLVAEARTTWNKLPSYTFEAYVKEFRKHYETEAEYEMRRVIFESKLAELIQHNNNPEFTWKVGVNSFTDRTEKETRLVFGLRRELLTPNNIQPKNIMDVSALPTTVDWREKGIISDVKDQGACGSCWTFGTTETIESHWAMQTGLLTDLSEQQSLDCVKNTNDCGGTGGCEGGIPEIIYEQLKTMGGLTTEWMYPYRSYFGNDFPTCSYQSNKTVPFVKVDDYVKLPSNNYEAVMTAVANTGPLAINVDASAWLPYESGVFNGCNQTNPILDHVVQLVGYGTDSQYGDYWLIRNSWSPIWGEKGYIRVKRNTTPVCGLDTDPSQGTGCKGGPAVVTVCGNCGVLYDTSYPVVTSA